MILAIDVAYHEEPDGTELASVAGVGFAKWQDAEPTEVFSIQVSDVRPYEAGQFYKRELPCIMALLEHITDLHESLPNMIVVDGYVHLGKEKKAGLGLKLYDAIQQTWQTTIPIIGVAKNAFKETPAECAVLRGNSHNPVYVTAIGILLAQAKELIAGMQGDYRIPTLLKLADSVCRNQGSK